MIITKGMGGGTRAPRALLRGTSGARRVRLERMNAAGRGDNGERGLGETAKATERRAEPGVRPESAWKRNVIVMGGAQGTRVPRAGRGLNGVGGGKGDGRGRKGVSYDDGGDTGYEPGGALKGAGRGGRGTRHGRGQGGRDPGSPGWRQRAGGRRLAVDGGRGDMKTGPAKRDPCCGGAHH